MKKIIIIVLVMAVVVAAVGLLKKRKSDLTKAPVAAVLPVVVDTFTLHRAPVTLTLPTMGVVSSELSSTLSTKISGKVTKIYKREGDSIQKGELLASIDARDLIAKEKALRSKIEGLDYDIAVQRKSHQRTLELYRIGGASLEESQKEEAAIANLEKNKESLAQSINELKALASYADITAPICGTLSKRMVQVGDLATPGKPLFRISACSGQYLSLSLPNDLTPDKIIYQGTELTLAAKNEASIAGLAQYIAPLPKDAGVVEGQFVSVDVVVYSGEDMLVPVDGLLSVGGDSFVFTFANAKAARTRVKIVARGREGVVVRPDLGGKTILIAKPDILLRAASGAPVQETGDRRQETEKGSDNG